MNLIDTNQGRTTPPAAEIRTISVHRSGIRNLLIGTAAGLSIRPHGSRQATRPLLQQDHSWAALWAQA
jgi:hypothetical protein